MHHHNHEHNHEYNNEHEQEPSVTHTHHLASKILTIRPSSGLSGDMLLAGLIAIADVNQEQLDLLIQCVGVPALEGCLHLEKRAVNQVQGVGCRIILPHEHAHRTLTDIVSLIEDSKLTSRAKTLATGAFQLLAEAEGAVHNKPVNQVHFHEVGALDSILDICLVCALFDKLNPAQVVCGALPITDGGVYCAHGWLPSPAPAVLRLLHGVPIRPFPTQPDGQGETVTPTAIALLKSLEVSFGVWPEMIVEHSVIAYGTRVFANAPNGAIFAYGAQHK